jgi:hypothetical protein
MSSGLPSTALRAPQASSSHSHFYYIFPETTVSTVICLLSELLGAKQLGQRHVGDDGVTDILVFVLSLVDERFIGGLQHLSTIHSFLEACDQPQSRTTAI